MLLSSIVKLSKFEISIDQFKEEIKQEVVNYKKLLSKKGSSVPILLKEDVDILFIDIQQLLDIFRSGKLNEFECSYIADALTMAESFESLNENDAYWIESFVLE